MLGLASLFLPPVGRPLRVMAIGLSAYMVPALAADAAAVENMSMQDNPMENGDAVAENRSVQDDPPATDCDMDECYYLSGTRYAPDIPDGGKTVEASPAHCQSRCAKTDGCERFTFNLPPEQLPRTDGDCTLQGKDAVREKSKNGAVTGPAQWPACCTKVPKLVTEMVTFGGVAISYPAGSNPGDECIDGLRVFTEDTQLPGGGYGRQEDAAAMITRFPHVRVPVLMLRGETDQEPSHVMKCTKGSETEGPLPERQPLMRAAVYHNWGIHSLNSVYAERIKTLELDVYPLNMTKKQFNDLVTFMVKITQMGAATYKDDFPTAVAAVNDLPPWKLVGYANTRANPNDPDIVILLQHSENGYCTINFEGSDKLADLASFGSDYGTGFCGFSNTHVGVRNELWQIVASEEYKNYIRPRLPKCHHVGCVGHSLGGALCELFVQCANSNRKGDPDYDLLAWEPADQWELLPEQTEEFPPKTVSLVEARSSPLLGRAGDSSKWSLEVLGLAAAALVAMASLQVGRRYRLLSRAAACPEGPASRGGASRSSAGQDTVPLM